ncbi:hypothetical protein G6F35_014507 [Rhizopus arrhizus]|nr:hypothetical protein G6F35_014507 [Rhizopus arrhizus]
MLLSALAAGAWPGTAHAQAQVSPLPSETVAVESLQDPAAAAAAPAMAEAAAAYDRGDVAWMLTSTLLVLLMVPDPGGFLAGAAAVGGVWLQRGVQCRQSVLWLVHRIRLPQGLHPRLGRQHADQGPAGLPVRGLPVDLRRHHHRAARRRLRRTDQVPRGAAGLGAVAHPQLHPDGAHRLGRWLPG